MFQRAYKKNRSRAAAKVIAGQSFADGLDEVPHGTYGFTGFSGLTMNV